MRALLLASTLLALALAGCAQPPPATQDGEQAAADLGPAWSFTDTTGAEHSRDAPAGNATVLFFMATWCTTCKAEAPMLAKTHDEFSAKGVRFYSLDFDASETAADLERWKAERAQPWPHGVDPGLAIQRAFGVTSQSTVVLLDAEGRVARAWGYGQVSAPELRAALDAVLAP